ncbi:MAG: TatD family hydrolase [Lentisphaerae bacterium]|jgi:TatD DNase family protein|nr:TatD family hydrolase [Lentisphaerota bacterium]MBT4815437.1 TatD family hydrolase [Lentisphaerota bacterium]MBT5611313.1 TatD family hydrolase [Lentisphaerota bacterium]MBT7058161.1 TatD family hydrolase [Lentisphaerota bacterium]MBT7848121.1 TatD family hydrolase [Lentisphaerota bacterium]
MEPSPPQISSFLFDTHFHIDADEDHTALFERARAAGVKHLLVAATTFEDAGMTQRVVAPERDVVTTVGVHPHEARSVTEGYDAFRELAQHPKVVAIGEIGLDYHYDHSPRDKQRQVFAGFLALAVELQLPAIVHCREAFEDCIAILADSLPSGHPFEVHSFTGTPAEAEIVLGMGGMLSFNGMVTFKRADNIRETLRVVPLERLLLETDAPFLAPVPYRGKRNEPALIPFIAATVADVLGRDVEHIAATTTRNGLDFFGLRSATAEG